jgi:hypothetical protein
VSLFDVKEDEVEHLWKNGFTMSPHMTAALTQKGFLSPEGNFGIPCNVAVRSGVHTEDCRESIKGAFSASL